MFKDIKQVAKDSAFYGVGNIAVKLVGFILIPLYTDEKYFSMADFGLMGLLEVSTQILIAIMGLSLHAGLSRWYWDVIYKDKQKSVFFTTLLFTVFTSVFVGLLLWVNVDGLSSLLLSQEEGIIEDELPYILQLLLLFSVFSAIVEVPQYLLRLQGRPIFYSSSNIIRLLVTLTLTIYFTVSLGRGITGVYESQLIGVLVQMVILSPLIFHNITFSIERECAVQLLTYSYPLIFSAIIGNLLNVFDRYAINYWEGLDEVGIYSLGYRVGNTLKVFIVASVQSALIPVLMKKMNDSDNKRFYSKILTYFSFGLMFCALGLNLYSYEGISIVATNPNFITAAYIVPFITYAIFFEMMRECCIIGLKIERKTKIISFIVVSITFLNILLNILLVPVLGMYGAALSTIFVQFISWFVCYMFAQRYYSIPYELLKVRKVLVVGLILYLFGICVNGFNIWLSMVIKLGLLLSYPFVLYLWNFYEDEEWNNLKGVWKKWSNLHDLKKNLGNIKK